MIKIERQPLRSGLRRAQRKSINYHYGLTLMLFGLVLATPTGLVTMPMWGTMLLLLGILGIVLIFTIVLAPIGLFLL